jgi:hypothetical protein
MAYRFPHVLILGKEIHMSKTIAVVSKAQYQKAVRKQSEYGTDPDPEFLMNPDLDRFLNETFARHIFSEGSAATLAFLFTLFEFLSLLKKLSKK